ncbi:MAG: glycosyltransferase [Thermodesulfovibrionales bacterium]|nr:glycosyltransferase [Thermodesulfovibrionales bacterium]
MKKYIGKVIHIMDHAPAYEEYADKPRPQYNWETPGGNWVGIWGYDWADLLAVEVRKINDNCVHEIWQPDLRADKIYRQEIFPGVVHRLIPVSSRRVRFGLKNVDRLDFSNMISELKRIDDHGRIIIQINDFRLLKLLRASGNMDKIVFSFMGDITIPARRLFALTKNIPSKINLIKEHWDFKKYVGTLSAMTYMNDRNLGLLKRFYRGPLEKITMGVDFDYWRKLDQHACRRDLQLPLQRKILFTSSRLNELKQVDRFIQVLNRLSDQHDFQFVVSGHGTRNYEDHLLSLARPLREQKQIEFVGYIGDDQLLKYYGACDLFVLTSLSEGASVSVIKALACETPVFTTAVGNTAEVLQENDAGVVVPKKDYSSWQRHLECFLSGGPITSLPAAIAREHYHWPNVAIKFNDLYQSVV